MEILPKANSSAYRPTKQIQDPQSNYGMDPYSNKNVSPINKYNEPDQEASIIHQKGRKEESKRWDNNYPQREDA
jgi:hypothetical protein